LLLAINATGQLYPSIQKISVSSEINKGQLQYVFTLLTGEMNEHAITLVIDIPF
jgi:hypothetical protein